jgi:mono/diheme cytochrome c family protein
MSNSNTKGQRAKGRTAAGIAALVLAVLWLNHGALSAQQAATASQGVASGNVEEGRRLFHQKCVICHIAAVKGEQPYGPKLSKEQVDRSEAGVKQIVLNGIGRMPGFRYALQPEQIDTIVAFLKTVEVPLDRALVPKPNP